jgi:hypothetical protein
MSHTLASLQGAGAAAAAAAAAAGLELKVKKKVHVSSNGSALTCACVHNSNLAGASKRDSCIGGRLATEEAHSAREIVAVRCVSSAQ